MFAIQTFIFVVINIGLGGIIAALEERPEPGEQTDFQGLGNADDPGWLIVVRVIRLVPQVLLCILVLTVTARLRCHIRNKYEIPAGECGDIEDCCCAFWCTPCTICQMARHTADFTKYPAQCCTDNGLSASAPNVV